MIAPRASLTGGARTEICRRVGEDGAAVAAVAREFVPGPDDTLGTGGFAPSGFRRLHAHDPSGNRLTWMCHTPSSELQVPLLRFPARSAQRHSALWRIQPWP